MKERDEEEGMNVSSASTVTLKGSSTFMFVASAIPDARSARSPCSSIFDSGARVATTQRRHDAKQLVT